MGIAMGSRAMTVPRACLRHRLVLLVLAVSVSACGGGGGGGSTTSGANSSGGNGQTPSRSIGGTVAGLSGTVSLQNNGGDTINVSANGAFRFATPLAVGQSYQVTIASKPGNQQCVVNAGSGVVASADISNVAVVCTTDKFTIGGAVSGLAGTIVLQNNSADNLTLSANGNFSFPTLLADGSAYRVTIATQPAGQLCSVASGTGSIASSNVTAVAVTCVALHRVGGTISGLVGTIVLQNNGADNLSISANGPFTFATPLATGAAYQVRVLSQPPNRQCSVASGSGTIPSSDVTNVAVTCAPTFAVGGTITGVIGSVVLRNGADELTVSNDGAFTFGTAQLSGTSYAVTFLSASDPTQRCLVASGTGAINSADITDIRVSCVGKAARYKPEHYSSFVSQNGTANLEGTWVLLAEGAISRGYQIAGVNPRRDYQLWSRTMVRVRRDPQDPAKYFVFACGPGGSRNTSTTFDGATFFVPFYASSTSIWTSYGTTIEDATTLRRNSVTRGYVFTGNTDGLVMGWNLSWVLKRISDDPFADAATVRDNLAAQDKDATCIYESEGTYVATENDGTHETSRIEGLFFWTDAYASHPIQLFEDSSSFASRFLLRDELGSASAYQGADNNYTYRSTDAAVISIMRNPSGPASSHSVRAESADGLKIADDTLNIPL
jgi:hypothetical protein